MPKKELEQRSYNFEISAEESEGRNIITGRPIVYGSRANIGEFDEIIHPGALNKTDLKDVRFLVNHDTSKIPLARSRRNNSNSTMQLMVDENGMNIKVMLDTENNAEARALYSAVQRGDISGMSFMFGVDQDDWDDLETDHPTRNIRSINNVVEVSAVTFPAYEATEINTRSKETLEEARSALEKARAEEKEKPQDDLELEKLKTQTLMKRYNKNHDAKGRFTFSGGSGGSGGGGISQPKKPASDPNATSADKLTTGQRQTVTNLEGPIRSDLKKALQDLGYSNDDASSAVFNGVDHIQGWGTKIPKTITVNGDKYNISYKFEDDKKFKGISLSKAS